MFPNEHKILQVACDYNGKVVSVFQVPTGRKCNCTCPQCGEQLEAKNKGKTEGMILQPNQKQAHFAHVSGKICEYATESAIHKMAKEILLEHKKLMLPEVYHYEEEVSDYQLISFDEVELEKRIEIGGIVVIPDAVLTKGNRKLFVEFYKSHIVDEKKREKLEKIGISTIEIDLNFIDPMSDRPPNYQDVKLYLETDPDFRTWLYNSEAERLYRKKEQQNANKPKFSLDYLKKQEEDQDEEYSRYRRSVAEQAKIRKSVEKWKDKAVSEGYELKKVYGYSYYTEETIYCPKEKKNENKKSLSACYMCDYFFECIFFT